MLLGFFLCPFLGLFPFIGGGNGLGNCICNRICNAVFNSYRGLETEFEVACTCVIFKIGSVYVEMIENHVLDGTDLVNVVVHLVVSIVNRESFFVCALNCKVSLELPCSCKLKVTCSSLGDLCDDVAVLILPAHELKSAPLSGLKDDS